MSTISIKCEVHENYDNQSSGLQKKKSVLYDQEYLKQTGRIGDVAAHPSLGSYPNLIFFDRGLIPRLLHSLVPIHLIWL